ncbi:toll/interleukin-1 receptor domain-containing protein [Streptomyces sp. NBS 14/10]|uniref:toll/interleukin-1 receptor domain-containing protein n=1 Tax=Streptomyces sp. NBS 14/10 TaxID=1945643 RepID=UPI00117DFD94|nr:toll/interleukin-1 receptor domain-containing protein [Streptomyces sp. NBS 14/10]KAK1180587.1 toll/interleukin-1 receptor domain-containing protein [Streptomyces sp. NBS 14/10]
MSSAPTSRMWRSATSCPDVGVAPPVPPVPSDPDPDPDAGSARYDVFISYSAEDVDWVRPSAARLGARGLTVAYDEVVPFPRKNTQ